LSGCDTSPSSSFSDPTGPIASSSSDSFIIILTLGSHSSLVRPILSISVRTVETTHKCVGWTVMSGIRSPIGSVTDPTGIPISVVSHSWVTIWSGTSNSDQFLVDPISSAYMREVDTSDSWSSSTIIIIIRSPIVTIVSPSIVVCISKASSDSRIDVWLRITNTTFFFVASSTRI